MKMQRASARLLVLLGTAASCTQLALPGGDYQLGDTTTSSGAGSAGTPTSTGAGSSCMEAACSPLTIAEGQDPSDFLAVDGRGVYWTEHFDGALQRAPLDGSSSPTKLDDSEGQGGGIVLNGGFVYWVNTGDGFAEGTIKRMPVAGGTPEVLVSGEKRPEMLAVTPTHLIWSGSGLGPDSSYVRKKAFAAGSPVTIVPGDFVQWRVAFDQKNVYAVNDDGLLLQFSLTGDAQKTVTGAARGALYMAIAGGYVYYTCRSSGTIQRVLVGGGAPETFYDGSTEGVTSTYGITVDDKYVYWTENQDGSVRKAPLIGGPWKASSTTVLAVEQFVPQAIEVDGAYVYWVNYANKSVMKAPK